MTQSNLHICFGTPEIHMPQLVLWSENSIADSWTINRHAKKDDRALFYMKAPLSSFVALGKVMADAYYDENEQSDWKGYYMAEIGEIKLFPLPIPIKEFRTKIPEWGFLKMPRQSIIVPTDIVTQINNIINDSIEQIDIVPEKNLLEQSINYTLRNSDEIQLFDEITTILETPILEETVKERLQFTRIGQERFRKTLITYWKGCCAVTGCQETRILRASHIKPWRVCNNFERLDVFNGLLLLPNLDAAFDQGLITFNRQGKIMISPSFRKNANMLGITEDMKIQLDERHQPYLAYHRDMYRENIT
jgi:hypothetical protein